MARGMETPECVFCQNYKRYGLDNLVRPEDVHVCLKHGVKMAWQTGVSYVCSDFDYNGAETGVPSSIQAPWYLRSNRLYHYPGYQKRAVVVAKFSDLEKIPTAKRDGGIKP